MGFRGQASRLSELVIDFLKTAESGRRIEIDNVTRNEIRFYSGFTGETAPAKVYSSWRPYMPSFPVSAFYTAILAPGTDNAPNANDPLGLLGPPPNGAITVGTRSTNLPDTTFIGLGADAVMIDADTVTVNGNSVGDVEGATGLGDWNGSVSGPGGSNFSIGRRQDKMVSLYIDVVHSNAIGANVPLLLIPESMRPGEASYLWVTDRNTGAPVPVWVSSTGFLQYVFARAAGSGVLGTITYLVP